MTGILTELIEKARSYFKPGGLATQAIQQDRWDAAIYDSIKVDHPKVAEAENYLAAEHGYIPDLMRDLTLAFYQAEPRILSAAEMDPTRLLNHAVLTAVIQAPEVLETRQHTRHDTFGTALALLSVINQVEQLLNEPPQDEAEEEGEEAADALGAAGDAGAGAGEAADALEGAMGEVDAAGGALDSALNGYQGEGPLSEGQQAAQDALEAAQAFQEAMQKALEAAIAAADQAEQEATASRAQAEHTANRARDNLDVAIRKGIAAAGLILGAEEAVLRAWGSSPGAMRTQSYAEREELTRRLRNNRMSAYVDTLGRFRMTANASQAQKTEFGLDEFYSTELSGELDRILDSELAMMAMADGEDEGLQLLQDQALIDLVEDDMISRKYRGNEKVGRGPLVVVVDTSKSMKIKDAGGLPREVWAKAFAMALLEVAEQSKRDFVGILFGSPGEVKVFRFPKGAGDLLQRLEFCDFFWDGGTCFEDPLDEAIEIIEREFNADGKPRADIVFATDDDYRLRNRRWLESYYERKEALAFRFFGIAVGMPAAGSALVALAKGGGNVRAVTEFADPETVVDIMQTT